MKNRTKKRFAYELASMLEEMPLEKVRVNDLCERCGERRQVLYYHFKDKYDLVAWIYDQDYWTVETSIEDIDYLAMVTDMLSRLWDHRDFYRRAFADKSQNSIEWHIHDTNLRISKEMLRKYAGLNNLTPEQVHAIRFHSFGSVSTTAEWLRGNLQATAAELATWHCERMPSFLREVHEASVRARRS